MSALLKKHVCLFRRWKVLSSCYESKSTLSNITKITSNFKLTKGSYQRIGFKYDISLYQFIHCNAGIILSQSRDNEIIENVQSFRKNKEKIKFSSKSINQTSGENEDSEEDVSSDKEENDDETNVRRQGRKRKENPILTEYLDDLCRRLNKDPSLLIDWSQLEEKFKHIPPLSTRWPCCLLALMASKKVRIPGLFENGMSLADYVKTFGKRFEVTRLACCISLCIHQGIPERHEDAFKYFDQLCAITDVFDMTTASTLINAFSKTHRWKDCLKFVEMAKLSQPLLPLSFYSPILLASIKAGDLTLAAELFAKMSEIGTPHPNVFEAMIDLGLTAEMLKTMRDHDWILPLSVITSLEEYFTKLSPSEKWQVKTTYVNNRGVCSNCRTKLEQLTVLTDKQFQVLKTAFLQKVLERDGNIFLNSTPEEFLRFQKFLEESPKYDVVVDSLNVKGSVGKKSFQYRNIVLEQVIRHFAKDGRVLVIGWKHMKSDSDIISEKLRRSRLQVDWFLMENVSEDDIFLLYAAFHSGPKTMIVSRDELRNFSYKLGPEVRKLMKIWQRGHQVMIGDVQNNYLPKFKWPDVHDNTSVQANEKSWHIPYDDGSQQASFRLTNSWLCVTKS